MVRAPGIRKKVALILDPDRLVEFIASVEDTLTVLAEIFTALQY